MTIEATAWKVTLDKRSKECKYIIQVENIDGRSEKKVEELMLDWNDSGYGINGTTGSIMLRYSRDFGDAKNFVAWGKEFPYKLTELTQSDKEKVISWGKTSSKKKSSGRQCGKCGEYGHNQRTCGKPKPKKTKGKKKKRKKRVENGPRKCKLCGKPGHNARTCKEK